MTNLRRLEWIKKCWRCFEALYIITCMHFFKKCTFPSFSWKVYFIQKIMGMCFPFMWRFIGTCTFYIPLNCKHLFCGLSELPEVSIRGNFPTYFPPGLSIVKCDNCFSSVESVLIHKSRGSGSIVKMMIKNMGN